MLTYRSLLLSLPRLRFDETLDRTDPRRARAIGASQTTTGASARRVEGKARAHERRVQRAADAYAALHAHATRVKRARGEYDWVFADGSRIRFQDRGWEVR
jgi:hypothetical protein